MSIYTGNGDGGRTELADGSSVSKDDPKIEALGRLDELMCRLGWAACALDTADKSCMAIARQLVAIQRVLFDVCAAAAACAVSTEAAGRMDALTDTLEKQIDSLAADTLPAGFIVPGGSEVAARLHLCRSACRSAERSLTKAWGDDFHNSAARVINRLSDYLFAEACALS